MPPATFALACAIMFLAGAVKGAVGFGMPMVAAGGLGAFLAGQDVVALLILPTVIGNFWQVLRQGVGPAVQTARRFWLLNAAMVATIPLSAALVTEISSEGLILFLGLLVSTAAVLQLAGWSPRLSGGPFPLVEGAVGIGAGVLAGLTSIWGPPVLFLFIALELGKTDRIRAQGFNFLAGSVLLVPAHLLTGILNTATLTVSLVLILPMLAGMWLGLQVQDRMNQQVFRRVTLVVLCLAGLNLLRRALF